MQFSINFRATFIAVIITIISVKCDQYDSTNFYPGRTGIVEMFEWKFSDIARECEENLGPAGFAGVQVSPVSESNGRSSTTWKDRYEPISYKISSRSGSLTDFLNMSRRCNRSGVRVYVDVVLNHMASGSSTARGYGGSFAYPERPSYPSAGYVPIYFHTSTTTCDITKSDVRTCRLNGNPDLDQSRAAVRVTLASFLNRLISYGVAGFRISNARFMDPDDLKEIFRRLVNLPIGYGFPLRSKPFVYHDLDQSYSQYVDIGRVEETDFSKTINALALSDDSVFGNLKDFDSFIDSLSVSSENAIIYVDTHETQREDNALRYESDKNRYLAAVGFLLSFNYGIPRLMSSYSFTDSTKDNLPSTSGPGFDSTDSCSNGFICEQRDSVVRNLIRVANLLNETSVKNLQGSEAGWVAFSRDNRGFFVFNFGSTAMDEFISTGLPEGTYCDVVSGGLRLGSCRGKTISVDSDGSAEILIDPDTDSRFIVIINE